MSKPTNDSGAREDGAPAATAKRKASTRRILGTIAIGIAGVHIFQMMWGEYSWASIVAFGLVAAGVCGWRLDVFRSVRTAAILMGLVSVACVLATLTVQRSQLRGASEEEYQQTVAYAWAHLLVKVTHPFPGGAALSEEAEERLQAQQSVFGVDVAAEDRHKAEKAARSAVDQEKARKLASKHAGVFAALYRLANGLGLTDAYKAWWFIGLFYLLCLNLVIGAVGRRKISVRNLGFHATHLGLVLVVAGATISGFKARRGFTALQVGRTVDSFAELATGGESPLGFSVRLDRFDTQYHEDLYVTAGMETGTSDDGHHGMMQTRGGGLERTEKLEVGKTFTMTNPRSGSEWELTMEEITESAGISRSFEQVAPGTEGASPAVKLALSGDSGDFLWLRGADPPFIDPANRFKLRIRSIGSGDDTAAETSCDTAGSWGTFSLRVDGEAVGDTVRVEKGAQAEFGALTATFLEVYPDFKVGVEIVDETAFPANPAARVALVDESGEGGEYLFFSEERLKDFTRLPWEGMKGSFDFDYWCSGTGSRAELLIGGGGPPQIRLASQDAPPSVTDVVAGQPVEFGPGLELRVLEVVESALEGWTLVEDAPPDTPKTTALKLGVEGPQGREELWLLSNRPQGQVRIGTEEELTAGDGGIVLRLADNRERPPRDWRSHISVLEEGRVVHDEVVEVNQPLKYGGFSFFQSDADPSRPDYSGLQVVKDPGWPLVAAGLYALLLGICWCFYVQPFLDRRRAEARSAGSGGA